LSDVSNYRASVSKLLESIVA